MWSGKHCPFSSMSLSRSPILQYPIENHEIWKQKLYDYDDIFSVCVLYTAHGIFIAIKGFMTNISSVVIKHTKSACVCLLLNQL